MPCWKRFPPAHVAGLIVGAAITGAALPGRADDPRAAPDLRPGSTMDGRAPPGLGLPKEHRLPGLDDWDAPGADAHDAKTRGLVARELIERIEKQINAGAWMPFRRSRRGPQILASHEEISKEAAGRRGPDPFLDRFRFDLSRGLEYRQRIPLSRQGLKLKLYGPIVSGSPGLGLQLRGRLADRPFHLKAVGSTDEAGLALEIEL